jgi:hypothetical protein
LGTLDITRRIENEKNSTEVQSNLVNSLSKLTSTHWATHLRSTFNNLNEETIYATIDPGAIIRNIVNHLQNIRRNVDEFTRTNDENLLIKLQLSIDTSINQPREIQKETLLITNNQLFNTFKTLLIDGSLELNQKVNQALDYVSDDR